MFGEDPKIIPNDEDEPERPLVRMGRQAWYIRGAIRNVGEMETITYGDGSRVGELFLSFGQSLEPISSRCRSPHRPSLSEGRTEIVRLLFPSMPFAQFCIRGGDEGNRGIQEWQNRRDPRPRIEVSNLERSELFSLIGHLQNR